MSKLHDFQELCHGNVSKVHTSQEVLQSVFAYRKLYIASCKSLPGISVLQRFGMFYHELFWNVIGSQYVYDGHTFSQEV